MKRRLITEEMLRERLAKNLRESRKKRTLRPRLAKKVREFRKKLGLTLKKAAERAEMHWRHWQKVEAGKANVTARTLVRLTDALSVDPVELIRAREQAPAGLQPSRRWQDPSLSERSGRLVKLAGLPVEEVAMHGGLTAQRWREIEAGDVNLTIDTLANLALGLHVEPEELFEEPPKR